MILQFKHKRGLLLETDSIGEADAVYTDLCSSQLFKWGDPIDSRAYGIADSICLVINDDGYLDVEYSVNGTIYSIAEIVDPTNLVSLKFKSWAISRRVV